MKISVIIPLFYGKKYIESIIDMMDRNVKMARIKYELEIIFVNDAPKEEIRQKDIPEAKNVKIILLSNQENRGIHYSRVHGLKCATGQYIMFFDQDDEISDTYFESQLCHIGNRDVVIANGIAQCDNHDKLLYRYRFMQWTVKYIWFYAKFDCRIISPGQCLIRKASIPKVWENNILINNGADDYFLWLVMLADQCRFAINRDILYTHVYTMQNASLDKERMKESVIEFLNSSENGIAEKYIKIIKKRIKRSNEKGVINSLVKIIERVNRN